VPRGTSLQDVLFERGVEFPCGGRGICAGCRVRVLRGEVPATELHRRVLTPTEIEGGWRLACLSQATTDLMIEVGQWETRILADHGALVFRPREGLGIAVDLGTTTVVLQLVDLASGDVLAVRSALNAQARHGADVMSRIEAALGGPGGALTAVVREQVGALADELVAEAHITAPIRRIAVVGNTAMHHLFCGVDAAPLAAYPFQPTDDGTKLFPASSLGWRLPGDPEVAFLPCLGGFVGSDVLAGIVATRLHESQELRALVDLGTNGEIVVGTRERLLCASTAAGPAFEGARISCGMRAVTGAISAVALSAGDLTCHVLGGGPARGVCGSGLVDAVAAGLDAGRIEASGRLADGAAELPLCPPVSLTQRDIRELQLAKGAIAAGLAVLLDRLGARQADLARVHLAGAFGNSISRGSALRIGLFSVSPERIEAVGNTALMGAKLALFEDDVGYEPLRRRVEHVSLHADPAFQDRFADAMTF
jgi:uncharacterized 2Fe-2S/4Fe-4S cluster protein (DUF4445 family)